MQTQQIRFIDNSYDLGIAKELLERLISQKIEFIKAQILDSNSDEEISHLKKRITDLNAENRSIDLFIQGYDGENVEMEIGCTIVMSIKKTEKP